MKKHFLLILCAIFLLFTATASADGRELRGGLTDIVMADDTWSGYSTVTDDLLLNDSQYNVAILGSRYHNALLISKEDTTAKEQTLLARSDLAVYQPDASGKSATLKKISDTSFAVCYEGETYAYAIQEDGVVLTEAEMGDIQLSLSGGVYDVLVNGTKEDEWGSQMTIDAVNIALLPRSLDEVRQVKQNTAMMGTDFALVTDYCAGTKNGDSVPVYAAPSTDAWRADDGKASMSLKDSWYAMGASGDWTIVMYQVSNRTSRVGCVESRLLGAEAVAACEDPLNITAKITQDTYITDDPMMSQNQQTTLRAGDTVTLLGRFNDFYAYVSTTVDGKEMWGFLPMNSFTVDFGEKDTEAMSRLTGYWELYFGGPSIGDYVELKEDGTYVASDIGAGQWAVYPADTAWNCFHDHPSLMLVMESNDQMHYAVYGLTITEEGFCLTNAEDSGSYVSTDDPSVWVN